MNRLSKGCTRGQALVMFVLVAAVLIMVLGLAIDASGGWWKSQRQNDAIEIAKEAALSRCNEIKFDDTDSTRALDEVVYSSLAENLSDLEGSEVSVTSWEVSAAKAGSMNRLIGVEVTVTGTYKCVFAQTFGFGSVPVKNTIIFTINPYSSTEVWRQNTAGHGCKLVKSADKAVGQETYTTLDATSDISEALSDAIDKGLAELS
ncbi:TadE/TadG family type IV pilus assembly protein [Collinsella sp. AF38-3AC]|uniref:TadE/TadG family type IV pilus assembly protein n=1 Tax=Collinsella sp. AF38-3AC TaxID=2292015 RepID=UPI000E4BA21C|nr:pilus assembly protein [Collinsella sp. AF38-3AC]